VERELAIIWEEILSFHPIGIHDKFLDLGGNSLAAGRIASRITRRFQIELPMQELWETHTVAALAAVVDQHRQRRIDDADIEQLIQSVESMSEAEAECALTPKPTVK
jgi:acyl carrier protein